MSEHKSTERVLTPDEISELFADYNNAKIEDYIKELIPAKLPEQEQWKHHYLVVSIKERFLNSLFDSVREHPNIAARDRWFDVLYANGWWLELKKLREDIISYENC